MTQDHEPHPCEDGCFCERCVPASKRYPCDRCGVPTRSVFEGEMTNGDYSTQLDGGLHLTASGYYGGFWDTLSFMGEEPVSFHFCHDCSSWLCLQVAKMAEQAKGGHFSSNMQDEGVRHAHEARKGTDKEWGLQEKALGIKFIEPCCPYGVVDHAQGEDHSPKEKV